MNLNEQVIALKGVGPKKAQLLHKMNIDTIEDILYFFPRDYQDRRKISDISHLQEERPALIRGAIELIVKDGYHYGKKQKLRLLVNDGTGTIEVIFFNAKYLIKVFQNGEFYDFFGKPLINFGRKQMIHPDFVKSTESTVQGIIPVYPLASGISQREMQNWQKTAMNYICQLEDPLPEELRIKHRLCGFDYAIKNLHFPIQKEYLLQGKYRMIFDELLTLQLGLLASRRNNGPGMKGLLFSHDVDVVKYIERLPYKMTGAQVKVINEIITDMESGNAMNRLVQGDVGSGKTAVAEAALYKTVKSGYQGVLMAPTELLAKQHYHSLQAQFKLHGIKVGLLTGTITAKEKKQTLEQLASGQIEILVGTHAVIQPNVIFHRLGLVITDEQHRFGVRQRTLLSEKGDNPHILVMTATPIPRTLAVILYGDLDISIIDELPPGRQKIITKAEDEQRRDLCYDFVQKELEKGRQAYVVTPLIGESEVLEAKSAEEVYSELSQRFSFYKTALLHGEMKQTEKDEVMEAFYRGEIQVLVSTVVIEVGINVPNATIMIIENAERFGLAQLHQLRGRVGRGIHQSYCMLITKNNTEIAKARCEIMVESQDGFYIAEKDLELRGPGELFGTRQHGIPDLNLTDLAKHIKILNIVKEEARAIIKDDPELEALKHKGLKRQVIKLFGDNFKLKL